MKRIISLMLVIFMVAFSMVACSSEGEAGNSSTTKKHTSTTGNNNSNNNSGGNENGGNKNNGGNENGGGNENVTESFVPVLRFAVASDMHVTTADSDQAKRTEAMIKAMNAYAASNADGYNKLDAIFIAGDLTDNGTAEQYKVINDIFKANIKEGTELILSLGNHDYNKGPGLECFEDEFGENSTMRDEVIGGYHVISLYGDGNNTASDYTQAMCDDLERRIQAAIADTGTDKPIFIVQHVGDLNTVIGTDEYTHNNIGWAAVSALKEMKSKYSNLVVFSGHTHFPTNDECSIWQDTYTAINTGTLYYALPSAKDGKKLHLAGQFESAQSYVVDIDKDSRIRIKCWDVLQKKFVGDEWIIDSYKKEDFKYTVDRFSNDDIFFDDDAKITLDNEFSKSAIISFPPVSKDSVSGRVYEITLLDTHGNVISTKHYGDDYFKGIYDKRITTSISLEGLTKGEKYTIEVVAINSLYTVNIDSKNAIRSEPLSLTFKLGEASQNGADIIDLEIDAEKNTVSSTLVGGLEAKADGDLTIVHDDDIDRDVLVVDGSKGGLVNFGNYSFVDDEIVDSFTLEAYFKINEKADDGLIIGATQHGGFSLNIKGDKVVFYIDTDPTLDNVKYNRDLSFDYVLGRYYHVTIVFDGSKTTLYVDGQNKGSIAMSAYGLPYYEASEVIWLGADVNTSGGHDNEKYGKFSIADFKLYSYAVEAPKATLVDMKIDATANTVTNASDAIDSYTEGTITTAHDNTIDKDVLVLDGSGSGLVRFGSYTAHRAELGDSMTVEVYLKINELPANGALTIPVGAMQSGGFGLEVFGAGNAEKSNKIMFFYHNGSSYVGLGFEFEVGKYYRIVAAFDGEYYKLYVDGVLVGEATMSSLAFPPEEAEAFNIWLGADAGRKGDHEYANYAKCSIAEFKVYNYALSAEQVSAAK